MARVPEIRIGQRLVGPGHPCLVVSEVSANHHQKYDEAAEIVRAAASAGADAVKLQTYTPDTMTIDCDKPWFYIGGASAPASWRDKNLYGLYATAYTPWEWHADLKTLAESLGLIFFSSPFDETAVDFLERLNVPCYKVASYEATDLPLLRRIARSGKPVIMSVGFATLDEVEEAVTTVRAAGLHDLAVLHCVTTYSGGPGTEVMNLRTVQDLRERFGVVSGFSDNNAGIEFPVAAVLAGASIVEKHLILSRQSGGPDARFSIEPHELEQMVAAIRRAERALGTPHYGPVSAEEEDYKKLRRSLFAVTDIRKGERFTRDNVRVIRPAHGLAPKFLDEVMLATAARDIERGTPLSWDLVRT